MSMMDILNKYEKSTFVKMAKLSVSSSLKKHIQNKADVLKNISEQLWNGKDPQIDNDLIKTIQNKLSTNSNDYSFKECRFMALYPEEIVGSNLDYYSKIRTILEKNWQDSFLRRLFISIINHWDKVTSKSNEARHLHKLFTQKLNNYEGNNYRIIFWKNNKQFFADEKGASKTGEYLRSQKYDSPLKALEILKLPDSYFSAPYFHDVIRTFYYGITEIPKDLEAVLTRHGDLETKKIILSDLIIKAKSNSQLLSQKKSLQYLALNLIGHPSNPGLWVSAGKDSKIDEKIKTAKKIINQWLIETFVDEIFSHFINDPRRRKFWLRYAKAEVIEDVKVVGCRSIGAKIASIDSLRESIEYNYIQTRKNENLCAFVMQIKGFCLVEFSDINNALYIYHDDSKIQDLERLVKLKRYTSVIDLKNTSLTLSKCPNANGDCRFGHFDGWETQLDWWFRSYRGIYV